MQNVPRQDTDKYGIVTLEKTIAPRIGKMSHIVEKPKPDKAESTLAVVGRYLLSPSLFDDLAKIGKGAGGEIQLTDGIARLMQREPVYAFEFEGKRYDCGNKLGYLQATVEFGLKHPSLGADLRRSAQAAHGDARKTGETRFFDCWGRKGNPFGPLKTAPVPARRSLNLLRGAEQRLTAPSPPRRTIPHEHEMFETPPAPKPLRVFSASRAKRHGSRQSAASRQRSLPLVGEDAAAAS